MIAAIDSSQLSLLLDVRHPRAYLALHPAAALADELGIEINWLPIIVPTLNQPSARSAEDDRGIRHRRYRAQAIAREIACYAGVQGLELRDYYRDGDPAALQLGWLWLRERHPTKLMAYLTEAFRAYWALELDASDLHAVAQLVEALVGEAGDFQAWCADDGPASAALLAQELRDRGILGTPCYVVGDEVFLGRQHLPMIRWMLEGRSGPVPI